MSIHRFRTGGDTQARRSRLTLTGYHKNATMGSPTVNDLSIHEFLTVGTFPKAFL
ncbi:MAG: hypothetical protein II388_01470 [Clostridia bacterium]|nr:hypothetical protein [Clostridia bacterium]